MTDTLHRDCLKRHFSFRNQKFTWGHKDCLCRVTWVKAIVSRSWSATVTFLLGKTRHTHDDAGNYGSVPLVRTILPFHVVRWCQFTSKDGVHKRNYSRIGNNASISIWDVGTNGATFAGLKISRFDTSARSSIKPKENWNNFSKWLWDIPTLQPHFVMRVVKQKVRIVATNPTHLAPERNCFTSTGEPCGFETWKRDNLTFEHTKLVNKAAKPNFFVSFYCCLSYIFSGFAIIQINIQKNTLLLILGFSASVVNALIQVQYMGYLDWSCRPKRWMLVEKCSLARTTGVIGKKLQKLNLQNNKK